MLTKEAVFAINKGRGDFEVTLDQIKYFLALAQYQSFSKAAEKLYISQPTLSRSISDLEYSLGVKLLSRDKNNLFLTEAGSILQELGHIILDQTFELENRLHLLAAGYSGRLKILSPNLHSEKIFDVFNSFCTRYPNISLELEVAEMWNIAERLNAKQADIGIVFSFAAKREEPSLVMMNVVEDSFCLLVSKGHPFFEWESLSVEELNSYDLIRYGDSAHKTQMIYDLYQRIGIEEHYGQSSPHIVRTLDNAMLRLKLFGGAMIVPSIMVQSLPPNVRKVELIDDYVHYRALIAWNKIDQNPAILLLKKHLEECGCFEINSSFI